MKNVMMMTGEDNDFYCVGRFGGFFGHAFRSCCIFALLVFFPLTVSATSVSHLIYRDTSGFDFKSIADYNGQYSKLSNDFKLLVNYLYTTPVFTASDSVVSQALVCGSLATPLFYDLISMNRLSALSKRSHLSFISLLPPDVDVPNQRAAAKNTNVTMPPFSSATDVMKSLFSSTSYKEWMYQYFPPKASVSPVPPTFVPSNAIVCNVVGSTQPAFLFNGVYNGPIGIKSIFDDPTYSCRTISGSSIESFCGNVAAAVGGSGMSVLYPWTYGSGSLSCTFGTSNGNSSGVSGDYTCSGCPSSTYCTVGYSGVVPTTYCLPLATNTDKFLILLGWGFPTYLLDSSGAFYLHPSKLSEFKIYNSSFYSVPNQQRVYIYDYSDGGNFAYTLDVVNPRLYYSWFVHNISSEQAIFLDSVSGENVVQRDFKINVLHADHTFFTLSVRLVFYFGKTGSLASSDSCITKLVISYATSDNSKLTYTDIIPTDYYGTANPFASSLPDAPTTTANFDPRHGVAPLVSLDTTSAKSSSITSLLTSTSFLSLYKDYRLLLNPVCTPFVLSVPIVGYGSTVVSSDFLCVSTQATNKYLGVSNYQAIRLFCIFSFIFSAIIIVLRA